MSGDIQQTNTRDQVLILFAMIGGVIALFVMNFYVTNWLKPNTYI